MYVFVAETLALLVRADDGIEGYPLPGTSKPLKIQQYADDSLLFARNGKSVQNFFRKVEIFQKASGSIINASKTRGMALGGFEPSSDARLKDITWTNGNGMKILGVTFYARLKQTINFNWVTTLNKIDKTLHFLRLRLVSLRGKALLYNALGLSKVWFLANTLPMPEWVETRLHTSIFENLWQKQNYNPVKRSTLFLPTKSGGLGILSPKEQCLAIHLKTLFQLKQRSAGDTHDCHYLYKYWLASSLTKFIHKYPDWTFLRQNNFPKHWDDKTPQYYKTAIQYVTEYQTLFDTTNKKCKTLYTEIIKNLKTVVTSERYWTGVTKTKLPWTLIWKRNFTSHAPGMTQNVLYRLLHNSLPTATLLMRNARQKTIKDKNCKTCGRVEDAFHIFTLCPPSIEIWEYFKHVYRSFVPSRIINPANSIFLLDIAHLPERHPVSLLLLTLTQIMSEVWSGRCHEMLKNKKMDAQNIIQKIIKKMKEIIKIKYNYHADRYTLSIFSELFCHKDILRHLENGKLKVTI